mmetsp:Transcript_135131/g.419930  ORF Transcript_135131/g.419930 Transcript_135131/m.419930 type:complete len:328 (+) Transcript_135131:275-1258(+)
MWHFADGAEVGSLTEHSARASSPDEQALLSNVETFRLVCKRWARPHIELQGGAASARWTVPETPASSTATACILASSPLLTKSSTISAAVASFTLVSLAPKTVIWLPPVDGRESSKQLPLRTSSLLPTDAGFEATDAAWSSTAAHKTSCTSRSAAARLPSASPVGAPSTGMPTAAGPEAVGNRPEASARANAERALRAASAATAGEGDARTAAGTVGGKPGGRCSGRPSSNRRSICTSCAATAAMRPTVPTSDTPSRSPFEISKTPSPAPPASAGTPRTCTRCPEHHSHQLPGCRARHGSRTIMPTCMAVPKFARFEVRNPNLSECA